MSRKNKRRLCAICASAAVFLLACLLPEDLFPAAEPWLHIALYVAAYLTVGWRVLYGAVRKIAAGQLFDEEFLMSLSTLGAFALQEYREAVAVMLFFQVGELFQSLAVGRSRKNIAALMDIRPDSAAVLRGGETVVVSPEDVAVGEHILVRPGARVPLDGVICTGSSSLNTAALTGESLPLSVAPGDRVYSGAVNGEGLLEIEVTCPFSEGTVSRILSLVESASGKKARTEAFITRFSRYYTPAVVGAALLLALVPPCFTGWDFLPWIHRALTFLVVSCPCALVISVPLSFFGGIGGASRQGILVKGTGYFEMLAQIRTVALDKTGTLTEGRFQITHIQPVQGEPEELLALCAAAESRSDHPLAQSVLAAAGPMTRQVTAYTEHPGLGVEAQVEGHTVQVGNARLMQQLGLAPAAPAGQGTALYVAQDGVYQGYLLLSDVARPDAAATLGALRQLGVQRTVMLTGDRPAIGEAMAQQIGVDEARCGLLPADKVAAVEELLGQGTVAYVGDGINDAPVLARADVGIAMGALGSDAAIEAADVVLMDDDLRKLPLAIRMARRTMRIVRENIIFALAIKFAVLVLAALGYANMWLAVFADVGVMVLAVLNAMRAMDTRAVQRK